MGSTGGRLDLPFPEFSDPAEVPTDLEEMGVALETEGIALYGQGAIGSRPTSTSGSPGKEGRVYIVSSGADAGDMYYDFGTGWYGPYATKTKVIDEADWATATAGLANGETRIMRIGVNPVRSFKLLWEFRRDSSLDAGYPWIPVGEQIPIAVDDYTNYSFPADGAWHTYGAVMSGIPIPRSGRYSVLGEMHMLTAPSGSTVYMGYDVVVGGLTLSQGPRQDPAAYQFGTSSSKTYDAEITSGALSVYNRADAGTYAQTVVRRRVEIRPQRLA
jgi:hypothetical protein